MVGTQPHSLADISNDNALPTTAGLSGCSWDHVVRKAQSIYHLDLCRGSVLFPVLCCHLAINLSQPLSWPRLRNRQPESLPELLLIQSRGSSPRTSHCQLVRSPDHTAALSPLRAFWKLGHQERTAGSHDCFLWSYICHCVFDIVSWIAVNASAGTEADADPFTFLPTPQAIISPRQPLRWLPHVLLSCMSFFSSLEALTHTFGGPVYLETTPLVCPWLYSLLMGSGKENWFSHSQGMHADSPCPLV